MILKIHQDVARRRSFEAPDPWLELGAQRLQDFAQALARGDVGVVVDV
jgi:hypothetical protein